MRKLANIIGRLMWIIPVGYLVFVLVMDLPLAVLLAPFGVALYFLLMVFLITIDEGP